MEKQSDEIKSKKSIAWKIFTFIFLALFIITLGHDLWESDSGATGKAVAAAPLAPTAPSAPTNIQVEIEPEDPILGGKNAQITIIEFSDFQCPFCARAATGAVASLKENEIKNGEVKLVFKDFPLNSIHPHAQKASEAAQCAHDQGKFWEYHDKLFENQRALAITNLKQYASDLGLDTGEFNDCLDSGKHEEEVKSDTTQATTAGGRGTPYFIIIGKDSSTIPISGAQPYQNFQAAIQAAS